MAGQDMKRIFGTAGLISVPTATLRSRRFVSETAQQVHVSRTALTGLIAPAAQPDLLCLGRP